MSHDEKKKQKSFYKIELKRLIKAAKPRNGIILPSNFSKGYFRRC